MKKLLLLFSTYLLAVACTEPAPSWPTQGGAGGRIITVTSLADSGPGTLREALEAEGPRIIRFAVGGEIWINTILRIRNPYITIDGADGPSPGITIMGDYLSIVTHDVILRNIRIRSGARRFGSNPGGRDCLQIDGDGQNEAYNLLIENCSFAWAVDEVVNIWGKNCHDIVVRRCIIAEGLNKSIHPKGSHSAGLIVGPGITNVLIEQNLFAHNLFRNPVVSSSVSALIVNNLIYNPVARGIHSYAHPGYEPANTDAIGNVIIAGPNTIAFLKYVEMEGLLPGTQIYYQDNIAIGTRSFDSTERPSNYGPDDPSPFTLQPGVTLPVMPEIVPTEQVEAVVMANVGARIKDRDAVDTRILNEVKTRTGQMRDFPDDERLMPDAVPEMTSNCDIRSMRIKGVNLKVQDTYYRQNRNIGAAVTDVKNLTVSGKLPLGTMVKPNDVNVTTAGADTEVSFFTDRKCAVRLPSEGYTVEAGENLLFVHVKDKQTDDYQVYTVSIVGTGDAKADAVYSKYAEPTVIVSDVNSLRVAFEMAQPGQVIGITKGDYFVFKEGNNAARLELNNKHQVIFRSVSGEFKDVTFWGSGFHKKNKEGMENYSGAYQDANPHNEMLVIGAGSSDITFYGVTVRESNANGFKINGTNERNITLDHCCAFNVCEYMVKGSGPSNDMFVYNLKIVNCHFENTKQPYPLAQSDHTIHWGDYVGAVDIMNTRGSYIADNTFVNILGANIGDTDRHQCFGAIGFWGQGGHEDAIVERNFIYNCGTGIMLGLQPEKLSSGRPAVNHGIVRNNIIFTSGGWDGIASAVTVDVQIYNNTIVKGYDPKNINRGIREVSGHMNPSKGLIVINNIANNIYLGGNTTIVLENNLQNTDYDVNDYFVNPPPAHLDELQLMDYYYTHNVKPEDFMLTEKAVKALGNGKALPSLVDEDFFGNPRGGKPDIGALQRR